MSDTDRAMECAEFVLGTLSAAERSTLERDMAGSASLRAEVARWEDWLSGLNDVIPEIALPQSLWPAIERRLRTPDATEAPAPAVSVAAAPIDFIAIRRSRTRWRVATLAFGSLAAGLALFIAVDRRHPVAPPGAYLAVVNRGGDLPALIVRVDTATDTVSVRSVAAETPANRVLELWFIGQGGQPRSLGLLDRPETRTPLPAAAHGSDLAGATLAVSVEPAGGSPTGAPTGQVIYSGKLIRDQ